MAAQHKAKPDGRVERDPAETAEPSDSTRAGGYVLTDQGWVLDQTTDTDTGD